MTSFQAIANSQNTNLAVVAPGIAEALFATALGLLAAIPATIFYNKFAADSVEDRGAAGEFRRRIFGDHFAPAGRAGVRNGCIGRWSEGGYTRRGSRRRSSFSAMSEINVTPLVDVMLVLLIVFMVAAPLMTVGVADRPAARPSAKPMQGDTEPITVSVDPDGKVFLQETEIDLETLVPKLEAIAKNGYEERIFVRGDTNVDYGR